MFQPGEQISKERFEKLVQDHITALQRLLTNEQNPNPPDLHISLQKQKSIQLYQEIMAWILKLTQDSNAQFIVDHIFKTIQGSRANNFLSPLNELMNSSSFVGLRERLYFEHEARLKITLLIGVLVTAAACATMELSFGTNLGLTSAFFLFLALYMSLVGYFVYQLFDYKKDFDKLMGWDPEIEMSSSQLRVRFFSNGLMLRLDEELERINQPNPI